MPGIAPAESSQLAFSKSFYRKILYRGAFLVAVLASVTSSAVVAAAQEERPQITPGERKVPRKKEAGPRALGVLRITASGKATLVPITILMSGRFYDASEYKASPVPMALETGTVYEGVRTGSSQGLFTVDGALHSTVANSQTPWLGTGKWLPAGSEEAQTSHKAENVPVGIDNSDAPPRLSRNASESKTSPQQSTPPAAPPSSTAPSSTAPSTTTPSSTPPQTTPSGTSGGPPAATPTQPTGSTSPAPTSTTPPPESKPAKTDDHSGGQSQNHTGDQTKEPDDNSGAGETNRPRLRRGKPVDPLPDEEIPGYSKLGSAPAATPTPAASAAAANVGKTALPSAPVPVQMIPAISDATGPDPRSFAFDWLKSEEGERLQQMTDLAKQELRAYVAALARNRISATPPGPQSAKHKPSKPPELILENARMVAYDLWTTNQPVLVFSAEAHLPLRAGTTAEDNLQYSIMLVARTDIYNNLHKLYVGVTDKNHLDITPRLELVDAVDADGDGRGELLFRETSDAGGGWMIYRASADKLWKIFDSLNPE